MSVLSEKVRIALFAKLLVAGVTNLATGGVHFEVAPETANLPFVVFQRVAPGTVLYSLSGANQGEDDIWMIKSLADEDSVAALEPQTLNELILAACQTAVGTQLSLTGAVTRAVRRTGDIPSFTETLSDRRIYHAGFYLRIFTE